MKRFCISRMASLLMALLMGLSGPGMALAHGQAHNEMWEHGEREVNHHHAGPTGPQGAPNDGGSSSVQQANEPDGHAHPQLAQAVSGRLDAPLLDLPPVPSDSVRGSAVDGTASLIVSSSPARASPRDARPQQPRAPPQG